MSYDPPILPSYKGIPHRHIVPDGDDATKEKYRVVFSLNQADCSFCDAAFYPPVSVEQQEAWLAEMERG